MAAVRPFRLRLSNMAAVRQPKPPLNFLISVFLLIIFSNHSQFLILSSASDASALVKFKESLTFSKDQKPLDSWKADSTPCDKDKQWTGVNCYDGKIAGLRLNSMGLSGKVDFKPLQDLQFLRSISMENNSFEGALPNLHELGALKALYASRNKFSGEILSEVFDKMLSLKKIWLAHNKLTGPIPESLGKLTHLIELHLEYNEFSGPIPTLEQPSLMTLNLSNNKLEGPIPDSLSKFEAKSFQNNPNLCGKLIGNECKEPLKEHSSNSKWVILAVVIALLLLTILFRVKRKEDNFNVLGKENLDEVVSVHIPGAHKQSTNSGAGTGSARKGNQDQSNRGGSTRRGAGGSSNHGNKSVGDLVVVNEERGIFGLQDLMKAAAEVLGNGGLGSAYKAVMSNGVSVVVKRLREVNKVNKDVFDVEIRRLGKLKHNNILTPLAYHYRKEEKLLVSEYVPKGSLLYILHGDRGISHAELTWTNRLKIIQGVARGMGYLSSEFPLYDLPHGNLKSSNILLGPNYEPLLTDFAFYPLVNSTQGVQTLFAFKSPEAVLYQQVSPKSDVYCMGIIILEILTGKFPSQYLSNQKGGTDVVQWVRSAVSEKRASELIDPEISAGAPDSQLAQMENLLNIGAACTDSEHDKRIDLKEAIRRIEEIQV